MRLLLPLAVSGLLLSGCSQAEEAVGTVSDCAALARDVASLGLSGVPSVQDAEQAVQRLDDRVQDLRDEQVREAATTLRDRLREVEEAATAADPVAARSALEGARDAARDTAEACGLPADQFVR